MRKLKLFIIPICLTVILSALFVSPKNSNREAQCEDEIIVEENPLTAGPIIEITPLKVDAPMIVNAEENPNPIPKDANSLLSKSNISLEELEAGLKYDLIPLASYFLEAEELYGVNACYLASIAALESGWGRYQFRENNLFGFGRKSFDTPEECIYYVAEFLATEYLSEDGKYFGGGYSLYHVNKYYNGSDEWYEGVCSVYAGIIKRIEEYRQK